MKPRIPQLITLALVLALMASLLPACAPAPAPTTAPASPTSAPVSQAPTIKGGPLEIGVLWEEGSPSYDLVKAIGDSLEKDYPGTKITYTFANTAARQTIEARMLAGNPIDIDLLFDGMDANTYDWAANGHLLDLTDALNAPRADGTKWIDDVNPLFKPDMTYNGKYYAVPQEVYLWLLHYNKGLFDKWGVQPPKTWDDLLALCDTIKQKDPTVAPIAVTGQVNFYVGMWWDSLIQRIVGKDKVMEYLYGDKDTKLADDPGFLKAAQEMMKLKTNGCLIDGYEGTDFTTTQVYFFQGKAAMILMGSWLMTEMKASIPEGFQLAVAPFPTVTGGAGRQDSFFGRGVSWSVAAKSKSPELATEFLRRFTSVQEATKRSEQLGSVPAVLNAPAPAGIGGIKEVLDSAKTADLVYYNYGATLAKFGLGAAWYDPLVEMWAGKLTPEQTIAKIDTNIQAVREQRKTAK